VRTQSIMVGIATHRRPVWLARCLESIAALRTPPGYAIKVFVAENDPRKLEGKAVVESLVGFPFPIRCRVVAEPGVSAARNAMLVEAAGWGIDFIAMIDDDETASPDWLANLVSIQSAFAFDVVGGPVHPIYERNPEIGIVRSKAFDPVSHSDGPLPIIHGTCNCLISTRLLYELDWPKFDPAFGLTGGGDREWFTRLARAGAYFGWSANAHTFEHIPAKRMTQNWILRRNFRYGVDDIRIASLHEGTARTARYLFEARAIAVTAPVAAISLLSEKTRLRMLRRWAKALGRFSAAFGRHYNEYALAPREHGSRD
jgi:succinoglycan biosynthesis protein ExoM